MTAGFFRLTPRVLELGYAYLVSLTLPQVAEPHLEHLVAQVKESSSLCVLDGDDIVYVARVPTTRIMSAVITVGTRFPAHVTSVGRVMLAALADDELELRLERARLRPLTARTLVAPEDLRAELARVRRQGYALVDQELEEGLRSVGAPVRGRDGTVVAEREHSRPRRPHLGGGGPPGSAATAAGGRGTDRGRPAGHRPDGGRRRPPGHGSGHRSRTSFLPRHRDTQIIIVSPASRSCGLRTESRCSGVPSSTSVSQVPQVPSVQE